MSDKTGIEWTDATWNPVVGCSNVSPACKNCYAARQAARLARMGGKVAAKYAGLTQDSKSGPVWNGTVRLIEPALETPIRWKRPRRIFVNSMSDLFHPSLTDEDIDRVFAVMALCPRHTFQVLTKRPERMLAYMEQLSLEISGPAWPLRNVWLGVTVENQRRADERLPVLLATPAAKRFVSCEPLLGPVDLCGGVDWVIAGGESGPNARPSHPDWFRSLRDWCDITDTPFHFKQWGEWRPGVRRDRPQSPLHRFPDGTLMGRHGKRLAGRDLDGRPHAGIPE